jgi:hypothetical protein
MMITIISLPNTGLSIEINFPFSRVAVLLDAMLSRRLCPDVSEERIASLTSL